jgi:hypothetical protein
MASTEKQVVATGGKGTPESPFTSMSVAGQLPGTQTAPVDRQPGELLPTQTQTDSTDVQPGEQPRKEFTVETPEVQAVRQQFREHTAKLGTGELALEEVGKAGRKLAEAVSPGVEVAGRAIGLDEEGAAALSKGFVEFMAGLPGHTESDLTAGIEVALAAIPMVGAAVKGGKVLGKALGPTIAKEFEKAVKTIKSERGSTPLGAGGAGKPPIVPPKAGAAAADEGPNIQRGFKRKRDPKIDALFEEMRKKERDYGFVKEADKQRRGTLSDEQVLVLSKKSDMTLETLLGLPPGTSLAPEHFVKAREILKTAHQTMVASARDARLTDTLEAYQQMFQDYATTRAVMTKIPGIYAEPSRVTRLMHQALPKPGTTPTGERGFDIADPFINHLYEFFAKTEEAAKATAPTAEDMAQRARQRLLTGSVLKDITPPPQDMRDLAEAIAALPSEEEFVGFMNTLETPTAWDVWKENWYNGMLLALAPIKNLVGTPAILTAEIAQRGVMAGLDAGSVTLVKMLAGVDLPRSVYMGEVGQMLGSLASLESFTGGARLAWNAFKTGKPVFDVSVLEHTVPQISNTALWLYTTGPMGQAGTWLSTAANKWLVKGIDLGTTTGARMLLAGDTFNKVMAHQAELRAIALRTAYQTVEREGLTGVEAVQRTLEVKREVMLHPELYPEAHDRAKEFAQYVALQEMLGPSAERIGRLANSLTIGERGSAGGVGGFPIGRWLLPFTTIMANAGKMAGEYSGPLQLLSPAIHAELNAGGSRTLAATTKIAFSSVMLDAFYNMARAGQITGNGPRDKNANRQWQEAEKKIPNAWWDPVSKEYRSCAAFEPFCTVTSAVADLHDMMSSTPPDKTEAVQQAFQALAIAVVANAGVKSWTQGIVGALNTAQTGDFETYQKWFEKAFVSSSVPYSGVLRQVTAGLDPHMRRATDLIETFMKDIPGLSESVPYERNALGKPMYRKGGWWNAFYHGNESEDPDIWQALNAHNYVLGKPHDTLDGVPLGKQFDAYFQAVTDGLDEDIRSYIDRNADVTDGEFSRQIDKIVADHRKSGKEAFLREFPDIQAQINSYQDNVRDGTITKPSKFTPGKTLQAQ